VDWANPRFDWHWSNPILDWCFRRILLSDTQSAELSTSDRLLLWFTFLIAYCVGLGQGFIFAIPRRCILFCTSSHSRKSNMDSTVLIFSCLVWANSIKDRQRYLLLCSYFEHALLYTACYNKARFAYSLLRRCFAYTAQVHAKPTFSDTLKLCELIYKFWNNVVIFILHCFTCSVDRFCFSVGGTFH